MHLSPIHSPWILPHLGAEGDLEDTVYNGTILHPILRWECIILCHLSVPSLLWVYEGALSPWILRHLGAEGNMEDTVYNGTILHPILRWEWHHLVPFECTIFIVVVKRRWWVNNIVYKCDMIKRSELEVFGKNTILLRFINLDNRDVINKGVVLVIGVCKKVKKVTWCITGIFKQFCHFLINTTSYFCHHLTPLSLKICT